MNTRQLRRGWLAALLLPLGALLVPFVFIDPSILPSGGAQSPGAAIAYRDHVHEAETLLTWSFARPRLEEVYRETACVTEYESSFFGGTRKEEFTRAFLDLAERHEHVDLYILAHTNSVIDWVEKYPMDLRKKIRFVYNSGCRCGVQSDRWIAAGAESYVAHPMSATHAGFFVFFLRRWPLGGRLSDAVREANDRQDNLLTGLSIFGDGFALAHSRWLGSRAFITGRDDLVLGVEE